MADSQPKPERPKRDPQALTPEYHKARKQVMLWTGILFIWELVGIDLEKAKEAGGNAGAIVTAIKSPQAVPWVLLVLIAYFLFKLWVEWSQCGTRRREMVHARIDYGSAWTAAFFACALYAYQALGRIQFADLLQRSNNVRSAVIGMIVGMAVAMTLPDGILAYKRSSKPKRIRILVSFITEVVMLLFAFLLAFRRGIVGVRFTTLGFFVGLTVSILAVRKLKASRLYATYTALSEPPPRDPGVES